MKWWKNYFSDAYYLTAYAMNQSAKSEVDFILNKVDILEEGTVLDMCCGYGRHSLELAKKGYSVTGVDYSEDLIKKAKEKKEDNKLENLKYKIGDIRSFKDDEYNLVLNLFMSIGFFEKEGENIKAIKNLCNLVAKRGYLVLELHNYKNAIKQPETSRRVPGGYTFETKRHFNRNERRLYIKRTIKKKSYKKTYDMSIRVYGFEEIINICSKYNMEYYKHFGGYDGSSFEADSERLLLILKKSK